MILATFIRNIQGLRDKTELLECMNWDEELTECFLDELRSMLLAAPPNLDKAFFWLENTPWECFNNELIPENVFMTLKMLMNRTQEKLLADQAANKRHGSIISDSWEDDDEWN